MVVSWLTTLSTASFGIYLIHPLVIDVLDRLDLTVDPLVHPTWWYLPVMAIVTFGASASVACVLQRIPGLRRLVP